MELVTGQKVWVAVAFGSDSSGRPYANVSRGVVLDGEHRVVKRDSGYVGVCERSSLEQCHPTEAAAWAACADSLERYVEAIADKAAECRRAAAEAAAKAAVVTPGSVSV